MSRYAEIILSKATPQIDKIYHYLIPANLVEKVQVGSQVLIPFGNRKTIGYVIGFTPKTSVPKNKLKEILSITSETPLFTAEMVELARWMADYYLSFFISALRTMMPPGTQLTERKALSGKRIRDSKISEPKRNSCEGISPAHLTPNPDQQKALDIIKSSIDQQKNDKFLLYGVTGSGKTEVYLQTIDCLLAKGKDSIVLVPEISLASQIVERFKLRFGETVAVLHSYLTDKERLAEWLKISEGISKIVLGPRSAVFAPVKNLGLIVMDEEFEFAFKQEGHPRYHAREVAIYRAEKDRALLILGTATPALETYYQAQKGAYKILRLPQRIDQRPLPPVEIVNLRQGSKIISDRLMVEIKKSLENKEQIILFMNRRGFSTFVLCRECGHVIECPKCAVSLSFHSQGKILRCHHCGFTCEAPVICPNCQSMSVRYLGTGTQRIELEIAQKFPNARIIRLDRDSLRLQKNYSTLIQTFAEGKADILIGTQLVTKGLDFTEVGLVGVINADTALNMPDFRAAEQTFQMLTQVAGRTGRHKLPGRVIVQTYNPEHYAIKAAQNHDYEDFYRQEIEFRRELNYPPFSKLVSLVITGEKEERVIEIAEKLGKLLKMNTRSQVLGPASATISKIRGKHRWQILMKGPDLAEMRLAVQKCLAKLDNLSAVRITVDIEPMFL